MATIELYWSTFRHSKEHDHIYSITSPEKLIDDVITYVEPLNLRIRDWGQYLMDDAAIDNEIKLPNARETLTYKNVAETIMSNSYVIQIVITTCKHYQQALIDGRVTYKSPNS